MVVESLFSLRSVEIAPARPIESLRSQLVGELITPDGETYDEARKTVNISVDRRPLAIVRAESAEDVATTVKFARSRDYPVSVRSGGHSVAHYSVIDGAILIDLSRLKAVEVDPVSKTARVQAGATSGDLAGPAGEHGLALSTGDTHSVGMGGLTTGGGIGFMVRKFGLAIDNLLSAQVVTADGEIVTANADEHPDLFWGIRGGGGNFGIITEFTYRLAEVPMVLGGDLMLPASREVLRGYLDYVATAPDDLTTIAHLMQAPPAPYVPAERLGELVLSILVTWTGDVEAGNKALEPLRALATPVADTVAPIPYPVMYQYTAHQAMGHGVSIRSMFSREISDATVDAAIEAVKNPSGPFSIIQFRGLGGAMGRVGALDTAFAHRDANYLVALLGLWLDPTEDPAPHQQWVASLWEKIRSDGSGVYVNFLENEGKDRVRDAYPAATFDRLSDVKKTYDPTNFFRFNQNIPPKA